MRHTTKHPESWAAQSMHNGPEHMNLHTFVAGVSFRE